MISISSAKQQATINGELALARGSWVKLICGASNQDLASIADLCAVYAVAGVQCVDVAADIAVVNAARQGLDWAKSKHGVQPWLMISLSDGKDIHFRKAWFNPEICPQDCSRPCQKICPAKAISTNKGIKENLCYGCGRCIPICPLGLIKEVDKHIEAKEFGTLVSHVKPEAIEIHTAPGRAQAFKQTVGELTKTNTNIIRMAVSCGLEEHSLSPETLAKELWQRFNCLKEYGLKPIWQLDGRPMSGDLGSNPAKASVNLWQQIRHWAPPGPLQLAGGTNGYTINHLNDRYGPEGIAFGGIARRLLQPLLLEAQQRNISLREWPQGWDSALTKAKQLISPWLIRRANH